MKRNLTIVVIMLAACWVTAPQLGAQAPADLDARVAADLDALLATYRHLHANPELSYQEKETAALVARELRALGFEVTENFGAYPAVQGAAARAAYGVVAVMRNGAGPTIMVRTDLDALPVEERTGVPYASRAKAMQEGTEVSVMHACGHDVHMTSFLGTARLLTKMKDRWAGTLIMIGQPAEERGAGAAAMLRAGLYTKFPRPQTVVALHVMADVPAGQVGMVEGFTLASSDSVDVTIYGVGGHGAAPHATKDPVVIAAQFINAIQTIVSRELNPLDPAVV
ncbi:MAG TPA: amidohydrolase, partial [Candidatus Acidoferrales bacterium]